MSLRKVTAACVVALLTLTLQAKPVHAQASSGTSSIPLDIRHELFALNYVRNVVTVAMEDMIDTADNMINNIYSYGNALAGGGPDLASDWRSLLEEQYTYLVDSRAKISTTTIQAFADASQSFSASLEASGAPDPTTLVQSLETLISGLAYSVSLLEQKDPRWVQHDEALSDYFQVVKYHVKQYNLIAGDIIGAIALGFELPYVVSIPLPTEGLPALYVPWETPPQRLPPREQQSSALPPTPAIILPDADLATPAVIESYIDGDFEGWDGDTIFVLTNGQIWQQAEFSFHYSYAYRPKVLIYRNSSGGYTMRVEGVDKELRVRRLK